MTHIDNAQEKAGKIDKIKTTKNGPEDFAGRWGKTTPNRKRF